MVPPLWISFLFFLLKCVFCSIFFLLTVAFITLLERKVLSLSGIRLGPNKVSFTGVLQPLGDAGKLANKSVNFLRIFSSFFYYLSSALILFRRLFLFRTLFRDPSQLRFKYRLIIFFLCLGLNSLNSIVSGWRTFRKFSLLGRLRTVRQLISYEASLYVCLFLLVLVYYSFSIDSIVFFHFPFLFFYFPFFAYIWVPTFLAELNRTPYDFSEGERELVSGFNTEFGSGSFTLIFLAEYANIVFFCVFRGFIFLSSPIGILFFFFFVIWIRSVLPRFRFDKLIALAWKFLIPFSTCLFLFYFCLMF